MPKLPYADRTQIAPDAAQALDALPDLNLFRMAAHADTAFVPWLRLGGALLGSLALDPRLRELAILQTAKLANAQYEWVQHVAIGEAVGVRPEQIAAIEAGSPDDAFDPRERALLHFTIRVLARDTGDSMDELLEHLPPREVVELLMVIAHYAGIAYLVEATGIETDGAIGTAVVDAAAQNR